MSRFRFARFFSFLDSSPEFPLVHRDLSWLQFNERVLAEAQNPKHLLLERVKFLAISASNLDEFFSIRVSALEKSLSKAKKAFDFSKAQFLSETQEHLLKGIRRFGGVQRETLEILTSELAQHGIFLHLKPKRKEPSFYVAQELFEQHIHPALPAPERFDIKSLLALETFQSALVLPGDFWIKVPKNLPQLLGKPAQRGKHWDFFFLDELLPLFLGPPAPALWSTGMIRLTRDGDYEYDLADADSKTVPELIHSKVKNRERGRPIRLQTIGTFPKEFVEHVADKLKLDKTQIFPAPNTLFLHSLWSLYRAIPPEFGKKPIRFSVPQPLISPMFNKSSSLFERIKEQDLLLHHPYDSFDAFIKFIESATHDPDVISIEQTIYRMDPTSPIIGHLKHAAKTKKVKVVLELRARFDEMNNLTIASELKKAGVKVFYGFGKLKLHAKVTLVTRKEGDSHRYYTHLSTGNYHSGTAKSYTDLAILSAREEMGQDARYFFDSVYERKIPTHFKKWVVAPNQLSKKVHKLIKREVEAAKEGRKAYIFVKVNALVDEDTIESLYKASQAGVKIDLVVRGACSLIPGVKGISENIRVISILDYFLEHSRIYYFENSQKLYLSSADWMPRNFLRRLEIAFPVLDERLYSFLRDAVLSAYLRDTAQAKELTAQGVWKTRPVPRGETSFRSQFFFRELAENKYRGTSLE
ncbi:MAG: polyphosphate kinase 1 [Proteobacteria bacterium]|nr:polyphosphate kinase 1 [Pseudomonadota bacterium]